MKKRLKSNSNSTLFYTTILVGFMVILSACEKEEANLENEFTGRSVVYQLFSGSEFNISGTATFQEKKDGSTKVIVKVNGLSGNQFHPVHLHYGAIDEAGELAALLHPLLGTTGESITELKTLANEASVSYSDLVDFDGSIRVHMDEGPNREVILSYSNIGKNLLVSDMNNKEFAICK